MCPEGHVHQKLQVGTIWPWGRGAKGLSGLMDSLHGPQKPATFLNHRFLL